METGTKTENTPTTSAESNSVWTKKAMERAAANTTVVSNFINIFRVFYGFSFFSLRVLLLSAS